MNFFNIFNFLRNKNTINKDIEFASIFIKPNNPYIVDYSKFDYYKYLSECPHLSLTINEKCKMFANGELVTDSNYVIDVLSNPNPLQSWESFLKQFILNKSLYGNVFIYKLTAGGNIKQLWILPSNLVEVEFSGKFYNQIKKENIINKFYLNYNNKKIEFNPKDIIFIPDNPLFLLGDSKIDALKLPISNIISALKSRNVIINDRGAMGILSNNSKDADGGIPLSDSERRKIEESIRREYGINDGQSRILVTNAALSWQPITFPTKDLMLFEEIEDDFATIIATYGLDRDIFPSTKGATYENKKQALKNTYQNTIQPEADELANMLSAEFGSEIIINYDWLPIFAEDKLLQDNNLNNKIRLYLDLKQALIDGKIDNVELRQLIEKIDLI